MNTSKKKFATLVKPLLVILVAVCFYKVSFINWWYYSDDYKYLLVILSMIILSYKKINSKCLAFMKYFKWIFGLILINCVTCFFFRQQSIFVSLWGWQSFFLLLFYPVFKSWRLSLDNWEKLLRILISIILFAYIYQNLFIESTLFQNEKSIAIFGETRVKLFSDGILSIGILYYLNKYLVYKKKVYIVLFIVGLLMLFLQGYRSLAFSMLLSSFILFFLLYGFNAKRVILCILVLLPFSFVADIPIIRDKIDEMTNRTQSDILDGDNLVRMNDLYYFYNDHFENGYELFLGSGMTPLAIYRDKDTGKVETRKAPSQYSQHMSDMASVEHVFFVDLGLIGLSLSAGIPFTIVFIILLIQMIKTKVPKEYLYLRIYPLYILIPGLTSAISYKHSNLIYLVVLLIMLEMASAKYNSETT